MLETNLLGVFRCAKAAAPTLKAANSAIVNTALIGRIGTCWQQARLQERQQSIEHALLKRRCQPEDLAEAIVFLGLGAAMVTGQTITVDGGLTL
jgi:3-oxoacyl-[acyl-carrier protein] reductase